MIHLNLHSTADSFTLTLAEKTVSDTPVYEMRCVPKTNGEAVVFTLPEPTHNTGRCQTYEVNTSELFTEDGQYDYSVWEGENPIETGILIVHRPAPTYTTLETPTAYKAYK